MDCGAFESSNRGHSGGIITSKRVRGASVDSTNIVAPWAFTIC